MVRASSPDRVRVLQLVRGTNVGGDREVTYQIMRQADPERFVFEIAADGEGSYLARFKEVAEKVHRVPFYSRGPLSPRIVHQIGSIMRERGIDLVHAHSLPMGNTLSVMVGAGRVPLVYTNHGPSGVYRRPLKARVMPLIERVVYGRVAAVTFDSPTELKIAQLRGMIPQKARALALTLGVDLERFHRRGGGRKVAREELGIPEGVPVVGCVGRMYHPKNPELFVRVASRLRLGYPEVRFVWIGEEDRAVSRLAESMGLGEHFMVTGYTHRVAELLPALDIFLLTSRSEGGPLVLIEALAVGIPVVASALNSVLDIVRDEQTGLLFPSEDEPAAVRAVERLLRDPGLRSKLSRQALEEIERFDLGRMVRSYEKLYEDVLR